MIQILSNFLIVSIIASIQCDLICGSYQVNRWIYL